MLQPARTKHRKQHKRRIRGSATKGASLAFGDFGLQSVECKERGKAVDKSIST